MGWCGIKEAILNNSLKMSPFSTLNLKNGSFWPKTQQKACSRSGVLGWLQNLMSLSVDLLIFFHLLAIPLRWIMMQRCLWKLSSSRAKASPHLMGSRLGPQNGWVGCGLCHNKTCPAWTFAKDFYTMEPFMLTKWGATWAGSFRTVQFHRVTSPIIGLGGLWTIQCLNGLIE